jgi:hypothetical protein
MDFDPAFDTMNPGNVAKRDDFPFRGHFVHNTILTRVQPAVQETVVRASVTSDLTRSLTWAPTPVQ